MSSNAIKSFSTMKKMGLVAGVATVAISGTQGLKLKLKSGKESKDQSEDQDLSEFRDLNWWTRQEEISPAELIDLGHFRNVEDLKPVVPSVNTRAKEFKLADLWLDDKDALTYFREHEQGCKCAEGCSHCHNETGKRTIYDAGYDCEWRTDCIITAKQAAQIVQDNEVSSRAFRCQALKGHDFELNRHKYCESDWMKEAAWKKDETDDLSDLSNNIAKEENDGVFFVRMRRNKGANTGDHMFMVEKKAKQCLFVHSFWTLFTAEEWLDEKNTFDARNLAINFMEPDFYSGDFAHVKKVEDPVTNVPITLRVSSSENNWGGALTNKTRLFQDGKLNPEVGNLEAVTEDLAEFLKDPEKAFPRIKKMIKIGKEELHKPFPCTDKDKVQEQIVKFMAWLKKLTEAADPKKYKIKQEKNWRFYKWGSGNKSE